MSEPDPPAEPPSEEAVSSEPVPSDPEFPQPDFLAPEPATEEPPPRRARWLARRWPFAAAGILVAGSLAVVYGLLHARHPGLTGEGQGTPATVTVDEVSLQREPSPKADAVATLSFGTRVHVKAEAARWVEVAADGRSGFLPADAIERDADRDARERRSKVLLGLSPVYGVVAEDADVLLAPYPLAARGGRLAQGSVIAIHSVDHSYFAFADSKWGVAFVESARVDLVPPDPRQPGVTPEKIRPLKDLTVVDLTAEPPPDEDAPDADDGGGASAPPAPLPGPGPGPAPAVPPEAAPGLLEAPVVITRVEPSYPDLARRAGIEGTVELEVSIDAGGKVTDVEVARGLPLGLSEAAVDAVRRWTWRPARTASGPVASRKTVRVRFVLKPED